jgi:hypothetical protein
MMQGIFFFQGVLDGPGDLLARGRTHGAAAEPEVHHRNRNRDPVDLPVPQMTASGRPLSRWYRLIRSE